jgi:hypothetical protein
MKAPLVEWASISVVIDRMILRRWATLAVQGRVSQKWVPGIRVAIERNVSRISDGASGLGSKVSCCGGPPAKKMRMQALA